MNWNDVSFTENSSHIPQPQSALLKSDGLSLVEVRPTLPELPAAELIRLALAAKSHAAQGKAREMRSLEKGNTISSWWFQKLFIFTPTWGNDPIWVIFFNWVETTN